MTFGTKRMMMACVAVMVLAVGYDARADSYPKEDLPTREAWKKAKGNKVLRGFVKIFAGRDSNKYEELIRQSERDANTAMQGNTPIMVMDEFMDQMAADLSKNLPRKPEILRNQDNKQVLVVGKIEQKFENVALEAVLDMLSIKLANRREIQDNFVLLGQSSRGGEQALQAAGAGEAYEFEDPLTGAGGEKARSIKYHPDTIYLLEGKIYEQREVWNHTMSLLMNVKVMHPRSRMMIHGTQLIKEYRYHPYRLAWISKEMDEELEQKYADYKASKSKKGKAKAVAAAEK